VWPHPRLSEEKRVARASSSMAAAAGLEPDLPLLEYSLGSPLSRIKWEVRGLPAPVPSALLLAGYP
jgi:hypothetical protein